MPGLVIYVEAFDVVYTYLCDVALLNCQSNNSLFWN